MKRKYPRSVTDGLVLLFRYLGAFAVFAADGSRVGASPKANKPPMIGISIQHMISSLGPVDDGDSPP